jgi:hypothetical protein
MKIHKPISKLIPVQCRNPRCNENMITKYLPHKLEDRTWKLEVGASNLCQKCQKMYTPITIVHLVLPNENGAIYGSLETSPGSFQEHPIKRWEIACEKGRDAYEAGDREDIEYPHMFTVVPSQASCYECLERLANTDQEELDRLMDYFKSKE